MRPAVLVCAALAALLASCAFERSPILPSLQSFAGVGALGPAAAPSSHDGGFLGPAWDPAPEVDGGDSGVRLSDAPVIDAAQQVQPLEPPLASPTDAAAPVPRFAGPCQTDNECAADERCANSGLWGSGSYCAQLCAFDSDCDEGPPGFPSAVCTATQQGGRCRIPCDFVLAATCPSSMTCQDAFFFLPAGTGSCVFF